MKIDKCETVNKIIQMQFNFDNGDIVIYTYNNYTKIPHESYVLNNRIVLFEGKQEHKEYISTIKTYINEFGVI